MKALKILVVEDEEAIANLISIVLTNHGFACDIANMGEEGLEIVRMYDYDILILDIMLPGIDGYQILKRIREENINIPVLILSGLSDIDNKVKGLELADDYLTKPFDESELVLRIRNIVSRMEGITQVLNANGLVLDAKKLTISYEKKLIPFTDKEYTIMELLMRRKGRVLTKNTLLDYLYAGVDEPDAKIIDVFMHKIRKKMSLYMPEQNVDNYIQTVWGRGYMFYYEEK